MFPKKICQIARQIKNANGTAGVSDYASDLELLRFIGVNRGIVAGTELPGDYGFQKLNEECRSNRYTVVGCRK